MAAEAAIHAFFQQQRRMSRYLRPSGKLLNTDCSADFGTALILLERAIFEHPDMVTSKAWMAAFAAMTEKSGGEKLAASARI